MPSSGLKNVVYDILPAAIVRWRVKTKATLKIRARGTSSEQLGSIFFVI